MSRVKPSFLAWLAVLALVAGGAWWLAGDGAAPGEGVEGARELARPALGGGTERDRPSRTAREVLRGEGGVAPAEPVGETEGAEAVAEGPTRPVRVLVVDEHGAPQEGLEVWIADPGRAGAQATWARTGADGRARVELLAWSPGELRPVRVREPDGPLRFLAPCPLEPELLVVLPGSHTLRGRLVTEPAVELAEGAVSAFAKKKGAATVGLFLARGPLDGEGRFELDLSGYPGTDVARMSFSAGEVLLGSTDVPLAELLSAEGALVTLRLTFLTLEALGPDGAPLPGVAVRVEDLDDEGGFAAHRAETDAHGIARLVLPRVPLEIGVGLAGWTSAVLLFEQAPGEELRERVLLRPLGLADRLEGIVLDAGGRPVAGAFVTLSAQGRSSAAFHATWRQMRTEEDGLFRLETPGSGPFELVAAHRQLGLTSRMVPQVPAGFVTLRFEALGTLRILVHAEGLDPANRAGMLEHALLDVDGELVGAGHHPAHGTLELLELREGERDLLVLLRGRHALGRARVLVAAGETRECTVDLRQGVELAGRAVDAGGRAIAGAEVRALDPALPEAARTLWSSGATDGDGRFRVFSSDPAGCRVELRSQDGLSWTGFVSPGAPAAVTLR